MTKPLAVIGGGGHARVVLDVARALGRFNVSVYDEHPDKRGSAFDGFPVVGNFEDFLAGQRDQIEAVVAIGANDVRLRVASEANVAWATLAHPSATVSPNSVLGHGTVVFAGAVVQPGTRVGDHTIVNTRAGVDHDCVIGDGVHVAPGATLCGGVHVGDGALIGAGATLLPGVRVGNWAVVGAGSVVRADIPDAETWVGVPARRREI